MREVHSPLGMMFGSVLNNRSKQSAADCLTTSRVSLCRKTGSCDFNFTTGNRSDSFLPGHEQLGNLVAKGLRHVLGADVGDALQREADMDRVATGQVILNALIDQVDQIAVLADENRNEQIADLLLRILVRA